MLSVFLQRVKLALDQWSIDNDKTNEPGSLKVHLAEPLAAYPALQLLAGDAIYDERPLLDLFQVKANPPGMLDASKAASFNRQVENCLHFIKDRWWYEARHYNKRPGLAEASASLTNAALAVLRLIHPPGEPLLATAERVQWRPTSTLSRLGFNTLA